MSYQVITHSYVTATSRFETLKGAREYAEDMEGSELAHEELDPQDEYPVTEVHVYDDDGHEVPLK